MKILYITYQVCFALPILLVLTIPYSIGHHYRFADRGGAYLGGTIPVNLVTAHLLYTAYSGGGAWKGENTQTYFLRVLCPITKVPSTYS